MRVVALHLIRKTLALEPGMLVLDVLEQWTD